MASITEIFPSAVNRTDTVSRSIITSCSIPLTSSYALQIHPASIATTRSVPRESV
jgi:hypothetical protein